MILVSVKQRINYINHMQVVIAVNVVTAITSKMKCDVERQDTNCNILCNVIFTLLNILVLCNDISDSL